MIYQNKAACPHPAASEAPAGLSETVSNLRFVGDPARQITVDEHIDNLIKVGELKEAEKLLEAALKQRPQEFSLLFKLGRLDEIRAHYLSAADLFCRAKRQAKIAADKKEARAAFERVRQKVASHVAFTPDTFTLKLTGNSAPLQLQYKLKQQLERLNLFETLLASIDPRSKSVLELECDAGLVARNLAAHGLKAEGTAEEMADIVLSLGFEYAEMLRKPASLAPEYSTFTVSEKAAQTLEKYDLILLLPGRFSWYEKRGVEVAARLIEMLAEKCKRQMFFFIPAAEEDTGAEEAKAFELALLEKLQHLSLPAPPVRITKAGGGSLFCLNQRQAEAGNLQKLLPIGLALNGSRSQILRVELDKCRSLNGFGFGAQGWNHFSAALEELLEKPELGYSESILKNFYERFQPKNRQEQLFGGPGEALSPLDRGWTLLPWVDTKNRRQNPLESPLLNDSGNPHYGPNSDEFGEFVLKRLLASYTLLKEFGYRPEVFPDGYIQGYLLKWGKDYRFYVNEGQHRIATLSLLGYREIKVKLNPDFMPVVDLKNISKWPQVRRGLYSKEVATRVFCHYFLEDGRATARRLTLL